MTAAWLPPGKQTFIDPRTGDPAVAGQVFHYIPGTSTAKDTWQDYDQVTLNANPITLDANGQCMIFGVGNYRQRFLAADGYEVWDRNTTVGHQADNTLAQGALMGLTTSNNIGNPTTQIDVAVGQCRNSTNIADIVLSAPMTKDITAVWAAGTGQGGRDSATALAAAQSWHVFVIYNPTSLAVDVLFSRSPTAPNLPNGYTLFRRIAGLPVLGGANRPPSGTGIPAYLQFGDLFTLYSPNNEWAAQTGSSAALLRAFYVPLGIKVIPIIYAQQNNVGVGSLLRFTDPDFGSPVAFGGTNQMSHIRITAEAPYLTDIVNDVPTNTSGQMIIQCSDATSTWAAKSVGWRDSRGIG